MGRKNEFCIEVSKDVFEKVIDDLGLIYSTPCNLYNEKDFVVWDDYWFDDFTGLTMAKRFNGYSDRPDDDPNSRPRYYITEYAAKKAGQ